VILHIAVLAVEALLVPISGRIGFPVGVGEPLPKTVRDWTILREPPVGPPELQQPELRNLQPVLQEDPFTSAVSQSEMMFFVESQMKSRSEND
jgi:hypothetical protein